jgi:hypothetical protein
MKIYIVEMDFIIKCALDLYQLALGGLREAFKITDPKKYLKR